MKKSAANLPRPPAHLSKEGREWWNKLCADYELDDAGLLLLETALECFDRMRQAQKILRREGIVIRDRFGQKKSHPATLTERDAKMAMVRSFKALNLDIEPLNPRPGRPPGKER